MKIFSREIIINIIINKLKEIKRRCLIMSCFEEVEYINEDIKNLKFKSTQFLLKKYKSYL